MAESRCDLISRALGGAASRRTVVGGVLGSLASMLRPGGDDEARARRRHKHRCPKSRRCGAKCCRSGFVCQAGICACPSGQKACGRTCAVCCSDGDCSTGICANGVCRCQGTGSACTQPSQCCSGLCGPDSQCFCRPLAAACDADANCCSGHCTGGNCVCGPLDSACAADSECCSGRCAGGTCITGRGTCPASGDFCGGADVQCNGTNFQCACQQSTEGEIRCGTSDVVCIRCTTSAECEAALGAGTFCLCNNACGGDGNGCAKPCPV
jgi:hypothetical protein